MGYHTTAPTSHGNSIFGNPPYAAMALALSVEDWQRLGIETIKENTETGSTDDIDIIVDRVTSLLLIRIVAVAVHRRRQQEQEVQEQDDDEDHNVPPPIFSDYSTSTICRIALCRQKPWEYYAPGLTMNVIQQLRQYVYYILSGYHDVPYHSKEHAFHVVLSCNKLLDLILTQSRDQTNTYGLRNHPIQLLSLMYSALIHDVEHQGIPNRQLVSEQNDLAVIYNDISVAENRSIYVGFSELLRMDQYHELRYVMFGTSDLSHSDSFRQFRSTTVNLVLNTDIANPERIQIGKSKWKEAFGDPFETMERKLIKKQKEESQRGSRNNIDKTTTSITPTLEPTPQRQRRITDIAESVISSCASATSTPDTSEIEEEDDDEDDTDNDDEDDDTNDGVIFTKSTRTNSVTTSQVGFKPAQLYSNNHKPYHNQMLLNDDSCTSYSHMEKPCTYRTLRGYQSQFTANQRGGTSQLHHDEDYQDNSENLASQEDVNCYYGYGNHDDDDNDDDVSEMEDDLFSSPKAVTIVDSHHGWNLKKNMDLLDHHNKNMVAATSKYNKNSVRTSSNSLLGILEAQDKMKHKNSTNRNIHHSKESDILLASLDQTMEEIRQEMNQGSELDTSQSNTEKIPTVHPSDPSIPPTTHHHTLTSSSAREVTRTNGTRYTRNHHHKIITSSSRPTRKYDEDKFQRRLSSRMTLPSDCNQYRKRLGIRRSMDLSGEALETYQNTKNNIASSASEEEIYDDLKVSVILECLMTAADVAHNIQGYDQMIKWSGRLYLELRKAFVEGRGIDPKVKWYENQIGFLESYLLPLARKLEDTGVFGHNTAGQISFSGIVEASRDKWVIYGVHQTNQIIIQGDQIFPIDPMVTSMITRDDTECNLTLESVCSSDDEEPMMMNHHPIDVSLIMRTFSFLLLIWVMVRYHIQSSALLKEGDIIKPGTWKSKCGLATFIPGMCTNNVHMHVHRSNGKVIFYHDDGNELGHIEGKTCTTGRRRQRQNCIDGLRMTSDGTIQVGGKRVRKMKLANKKHRQGDRVVGVVSWPFPEKAKIEFS